jgi:hypothetical protein
LNAIAFGPVQPHHQYSEAVAGEVEGTIYLAVLLIDRLDFAEALHHARVTGARLLISKLDRLSRDALALFVSRTAQIGYEFADCHCPLYC